MAAPEWITLKQAAARSGRSEKTVRRWTSPDPATGQVQVESKKVGNRLQIRTAELDKHLGAIGVELVDEFPDAAAVEVEPSPSTEDVELYDTVPMQLNDVDSSSDVFDVVDDDPDIEEEEEDTDEPSLELPAPGKSHAVEQALRRPGVVVDDKQLRSRATAPRVRHHVPTPDQLERAYERALTRRS